MELNFLVMQTQESLWLMNFEKHFLPFLTKTFILRFIGQSRPFRNESFL